MVTGVYAAAGEIDLKLITSFLPVQAARMYRAISERCADRATMGYMGGWGARRAILGGAGVLGVGGMAWSRSYDPSEHVRTVPLVAGSARRRPAVNAASRSRAVGKTAITNASDT